MRYRAMNVKRWCELGFCLLLAAAIRPAQAGPPQSAVKLWEQDLVIPTYRVGEPEKNPIFFDGRDYQGAKGPCYPYPLLDQLTDIKQNKTYRAVYLENRYVEYSILPEIGGRIFSGRDKTNGYDFIYRQHAIKPALIGMLGAWISGGIEWDIPHHHRATTFMTVDHRLVENADGSRTVWLGEIELRDRMKWLVGLTLYPDKSYLKATVKLLNRTPLPHTLLYFANVAVPASPGYQVIFPPSTHYGTYHAKSEFVAWPIGDGEFNERDRSGVDLSWWKNHPAPISIFAWDGSEDFFGGYDHGRQAGMAIFADHHVAPGKKFFTWGSGSENRKWEKILSDGDGPYIELMAGGYSDNQPDYSWIQPGETKVVEQFFYPIRELGGIKNANLDAAVNLEVRDGKIRVAFNTTSEFRDAKATLRAGKWVLLSQTITINPAKPFVTEITLPAIVKEEDLIASLTTAEGKQLIRYQPVVVQASRLPGAAETAAPQVVGPVPKPVVPPPPPKDIKTNEELYLAGLRLEQFHNPAREPYPYYEEVLKRDPGDYRANVALGILYLKRGMFAEAEARLTAAVQRATYNYTRPKDGEAFYYLGVALRFQGKEDDADNAFQKAAWSLAWYGPANHALAESACRRHDFAKALEYVDRAISANALNAKALDLKITLLRKLGQCQECNALLAQVDAVDPLDYWAANERYLTQSAMSRPTEAKDALDRLNASMYRDVQTRLELAIDYGNCGLYEEAVYILELLNIAPHKARVYPMVNYYLGYYLEKLGRRGVVASGYYRAASLVAPDYCFPFRLESIDVLRHAMAANPKDARAPYYLGNLLYDLQPQAAIRAWEQSRQLDDKFATVHRNLGLAYARVEHDNAKAIASLEKAVACDPADPKLLAELDGLYEAGNVDPEKRLAVLEQHHAVAAKRDDALLREISLEILLGRYNRAIELVENHHFRLWEGERGIHDVYADAHLARGRQLLQAKRYAEARKDFEAALEYPERLESARSTRGGGRAAEAKYFLAAAYEAEGAAQQARSCLAEAARGRGEWNGGRYYQALAYRKLGQEDKAAAIFEGLIRGGRERLEKAADLDFFAKFGRRQSPTARNADAHWLIGLGYLGKGRPAEAKKEFQAALEYNAAHLGARTMLAAAK